jgi:glycosidase
MTLADNHDMARVMFEAEGDTARVKQVLTMLLTTRGTPQLLYGTELGMVGGASHVELRADMPGGFPGDTRNAFVEAGRTEGEQAMFSFVQELLRLRRQHPALRRGTLAHVPPTYNEDVYVYLRAHGEDRVVVALNGHDEPRPARVAELFADPAEARRVRLVDARTGEAVPVGADGRIEVPPHGALVLRVEG